jgi:hypothetical protein
MGLLGGRRHMERRSRLVMVGLAIVVLAFLYLVYVAGSTLRGDTGPSPRSGVGATVIDPR